VDNRQAATKDTVHFWPVERITCGRVSQPLKIPVIMKLGTPDVADHEP
jgi:hypothetical protein